MRSSGRFAAPALACASIIVITAGCSAGDSSNSKGSSASAPQQGTGQGKDAAGPQAAQGGTAGKPNSVPPAQLTVDSRSLIFTGTVTIRVSDVGRAAAEIGTLAATAGGFVGGDDRTSGMDGSQARLTLRVPSARFADVVTGISKLGRNGRDESRQLSTQDVTDQVTDVDARIATGQASVDRVRELLAKAQNIGEIVSLESELSRREADLESLKSRKRKLDDLTTLSTVTAVLLGPQATAVKSSPGRPKTGFVAGLAAGWHAFAASMRVLLTVLGALLPWLAGLGLPALAVLWTLRRLRRSRARSDSAASKAPVAVPAGVPATAPAGTD
jgi:hypothetical protein